MQQQKNKEHSISGTLLVFYGMIASGKSYLASAWAARHKAAYYNSDRVRKKLAGILPETGQQESIDKGIYSPEFSRRTYDALIDHAEAHFHKNPQAIVVLDGSYQSAEERGLLKRHFADRVQILFVYCFCSEDVVKERLRLRAQDPTAVSDGTWDIFLAQKERFQQITDRENLHMQQLDTDAQLTQLLEKIDEIFPVSGVAQAT